MMQFLHAGIQPERNQQANRDGEQVKQEIAKAVNTSFRWVHIGHVAFRVTACAGRAEELAQRVFNFAEPIRALENFTRLGTVGGANDAVALHQIDEMSGATIADAQTPLQQ